MFVLDIDNVKIIGKNKKYIKSRVTGNLILSPEYRDFKTQLFHAMKKVNLDGPYYVTISLSTYLDIDAPVQAIFDTLEDKGIIKNDREILEYTVKKYPIKKGELGRIQVDIS